MTVENLMKVDMSEVVPVAEMKGEDEEDQALLTGMHEEATSFLRDFKWCRDIKEVYYGLGIGGVVAVFLFRIEAPPEVDEWLWVVVGDLPTAYLVTDEAPTPVAALQVYSRLMRDWVDAVRRGGPMDEVYPVAAPATDENADMLARRLDYLKSDIIPMFE